MQDPKVTNRAVDDHPGNVEEMLSATVPTAKATSSKKVWNRLKNVTTTRRLKNMNSDPTLRSIKVRSDHYSWLKTSK